MKHLQYGRLAKDDDLPWEINGVELKPPLATRREEFTFVLDTMRRVLPMRNAYVLDAGTGFAVGAHMLPYILANEGYRVLAIDEKCETLTMPPRKNVERLVRNMSRLPYEWENTFDAWCSVSVLEHVSERCREYTLREAFRTLKPGGWAIITADNFDPDTLKYHADAFGFEVADEPEPFAGSHLEPPVTFIVARKPL